MRAKLLDSSQENISFTLVGQAEENGNPSMRNWRDIRTINHANSRLSPLQLQTHVFTRIELEGSVQQVSVHVNLWTCD